MKVMSNIRTPESIKEMTDMEKMASGMQSKRYDRDENIWYKQDYLGTEGLSEYAASMLLQESSVPHVVYNPCSFMMGNREVIGCKSDNFLNDGERLVSIYELIEQELHIDITKEISHMEDVEDRIKFFVDTVVNLTGYEKFGEYLTNLLQLDAVTKNDDRHFNNISFIQDQEGNYRPAPIYDNGSAFLSDKYTYGENLTEDQIIKEMDGVLAKPFSLDFDEQLDICEKLYPSTIQLKKNVVLDDKMLSKYYREEDIVVVKEIISQAQRKYSYLFTDNKIQEANTERV